MRRIFPENIINFHIILNRLTLRPSDLIQAQISDFVSHFTGLADDMLSLKAATAWL